MLAKFWEPLAAKKVQCNLCQHTCVIDAGQRGICGVRVNRGGVLYTLVGDVVAAVQIDPVEKKPLYHYLPGTRTYSLGTVGCNFDCAFCQNHHLSQRPASPDAVLGKRSTAAILVQEALRHDAESISYTYNEPTIFYELLHETAALAQSRSIANIMVTNGFQRMEVLESLYRRINAVNVDLKSFRDVFYQKHCKARLAPVLDNIKRMKSFGWWVEVTTLLIPGQNDSPEEIADIAHFIRNELGPDVPWHLSRFHGAHHWRHLPDTPIFTLEGARQMGKDAGLHYVYIGNAGSGEGTATRCPECQTLCVTRTGFSTKLMLKNGCCPSCKTPIAGSWR